MVDATKKKVKVKVKIKDLQPAQWKIVNDILMTDVYYTKYFAIKASRQAGKTFMLERIGYILAFDGRDLTGCFIMATNKQTKKVFRSMCKWIPKRTVLKTNNTDASRYIEFVNGTILHFFSSNAYDSVAGESFDFRLFDEFALWNPRAWPIIRPTSAAKPKCKTILASTPRGKNEFYKMCLRGQDKLNVFTKYYSMHWTDNRYYDVREVEEARKSMSKQLYDQEFEAKFISGSSTVFGEFVDNQSIAYWTEPVRSKRYFFGIDWSGSGADKTILTIINQDGKVCKVYECESTSMPAQCREMTPIIKKYDAIGYSELNGLGKGGTDIMEESVNGVNGFWMTNEAKQDLVKDILVDINNNFLQLPTSDFCPELDNEMTIYESTRTATGKIKYGHPTLKGDKDDELEIGLHDDYVDSLMLANAARRELTNSDTATPDLTEDEFNELENDYFED